MSSRIDRETENIVPQMIADLRSQLDSFKTNNQAVGPDSVVMQRIPVTGTFDFGSALSPYQLKTWRITFTADTQLNPYADFTSTQTLTYGTGYEVYSFWPDVTNTTGKSRSWIYQFSNDADSTTLTVSVVLRASDTGTITAVVI